MQTGQDLYRYLANKTDQDYTSFLGGTIKANRLFKDALFAVLEERFKSIESQQYRDDVNFLIKTDKVYSLNNNSIYEAPLQIVSISFQATTATITTALPHNMITGDAVTLAGVLAAITPNINTAFTATVATPTIFTIPFVWTSGVYTVNSGTIVSSKQLSDYWQMIDVRARYDVLLDVAITAASAGTPAVITLGKRTALRTKSRVSLSGINSNVDGDRYLKQLNDFQYAVYSDVFLRVPVAGLAGYTSGGTISQIFYNTCKPFLPRTEGSPLGDPQPDIPKWKDTERMLKFYPLDTTCREITINYYKVPDVQINVADNIIDLTNYYSEKFLFHLVDVAAKLFAVPARDEMLWQQEGNLTQTNN